MNNGRIDLSKATRFVPPSYAEALSPTPRAQVGDVLYSVTGSYGIPALVRSDTPFVFQRHIAILRPSPERCDSSWLAYIMAAPQILAQAREIATGTAQLTVPLTGLRNLQVPLTPLAEQRRIVAKLDALTTRLARARAELDRVFVLATHLRDAVLASTRNELGQYPAVTVADLAAAVFDGPFGSNLKSADYTSSGARVIRLENIGHLRFLSEKETFVSEQKFASLRRHRLQTDDILFSSFVDREVRVCRYPGGGGNEAINKADCFVVRVDRTICDVGFLTYVLAAPATYEVMRSSVHGATRPRVSLSQLRSYSVGLPPLGRQKELAVHIEATFARADRLEAEADRARVLLDRLECAILAKAFRGELVAQDPNDEPASVMLKRIRDIRAEQPQSRRARTPHRLPRNPREKAAMTKNRNDNDVKEQPYLAMILRDAGGSAEAEALFKQSELPIADFYKQLAWEIDAGHIRNDDKVLEAT
jgi:type I restriction enzyme S subunit